MTLGLKCPAQSKMPGHFVHVCTSPSWAMLMVVMRKAQVRTACVFYSRAFILVQTKCLQGLGLEKMPLKAVEMGKSPASLWVVGRCTKCCCAGRWGSRAGTDEAFWAICPWCVTGVAVRWGDNLPERLGLVCVPSKADVCPSLLPLPEVWVLAATHVK